MEEMGTGRVSSLCILCSFEDHVQASGLANPPWPSSSLPFLPETGTAHVLCLKPELKRLRGLDIYSKPNAGSSYHLCVDTESHIGI